MVLERNGTVRGAAGAFSGATTEARSEPLNDMCSTRGKDIALIGNKHGIMLLRKKTLVSDSHLTCLSSSRNTSQFT